jgi:NAD(P)-dependent dehydrogenase (short-subunit alcohol dehydrogenase family)
MSGRLEGKVAVVTGGASGIGAATARRFVGEGARVIVCDLQADLGAALCAELGDATRFIRTDVTLESDIAAAVDLAVSTFGGLDVMFNNAGIVGAIGSIAETSSQAWEKTIAVLLDGVFYGMKHAARVMIPQRRGAIISTSSTAGIQGGLGPHAYTAAKHAVIGLTKSVSAELAQYGVRVNAISPGSTVSPLTAAVISGDHLNESTTTKAIASTSPLGIAAVADDIANAALYLASDEARIVTGHTLVVDAGVTTNGGSNRFHSAPAALLEEAGKQTLTSS